MKLSSKDNQEILKEITNSKAPSKEQLAFLRECQMVAETVRKRDE